MARTKQASEYQAPAPNVEDVYRGQGGSYLLDPETGLRTLVSRTQPLGEAQVEIESYEVIPDATPDTETSHPD